MNTLQLYTVRKLLLGFLLIFLTLPTHAQPKREFRGAWITTGFNLDWPSVSGLPADKQKAEYQDLLDSLKSYGMNAVVLQVRAAGDAIYPTQYAPWAISLSGKEGTAPAPLYDPLSFAIEATHAHAMEFHAWFNPFRVAVNWSPGKRLGENHIYLQHPEWCITYGTNLYLDPGIPAVRDYVKDLVLEVVKQYPIDAVHFDDYFYPYPKPGEPFPDDSSFYSFARDTTDRAAWRRGNINTFIEDLRREMLDLKPEVQFGISPFGVWRNQKDDPRGSSTRAGVTSYDALHADILYWLEKGWIDYVAPQIYFSVGYPPADYEILLDWWKSQVTGTQLYIGHAVYKVGNNSDKRWDDPSELPDQIRLLRAQEVPGSIFFRSQFLKENPLSVTDSIRKSLYAHPALLPISQYTPSFPPLLPSDFRIRPRVEGIELQWDAPPSGTIRYYAIYRAEGQTVPDATGAFLYAVLPDTGNIFLDKNLQNFRKYTYRITALDKAYQESGPTASLSRRYAWGWFRKWKMRQKKR
ncbi:MAG: family 10 glycosylhydrolase [Bacteroidota bacterium]